MSSDSRVSDQYVTSNLMAGTETSEPPDASTSLTPDKDVSVYYYNLVSAVYLYGAPLLMIAGTVGNGLSALVILKRKVLRAPCSSVYLVSLAVLDTVILYTGLGRYWLREVAKVDVRNLSISGCKAHLALLYFSIQLEAWVIVHLTIERLVAVMWPHLMKVYYTKRRAILALVITGIILAAFDMHFFFTQHLLVVASSTGQVHMCTVKRKHTDFIANVWPWIDLVVASLLPFLILVVVNLVIAIKVVKHNRTMKAVITQSANKMKMTNMTAILFAVSVTFLILTAPICIFIAMLSVSDGNVSPAFMAKLMLIFAVMNILYYLNCVINFVMYYISSPKFRKECFSMFARKSSVSPVSTLGNTFQPDPYLSAMRRLRATSQPRNQECSAPSPNKPHSRADHGNISHNGAGTELSAIGGMRHSQVFPEALMIDGSMMSCASDLL